MNNFPRKSDSTEIQEFLEGLADSLGLRNARFVWPRQWELVLTTTDSDYDGSGELLAIEDTVIVLPARTASILRNRQNALEMKRSSKESSAVYTKRTASGTLAIST